MLRLLYSVERIVLATTITVLLLRIALISNQLFIARLGRQHDGYRGHVWFFTGSSAGVAFIVSVVALIFVLLTSLHLRHPILLSACAFALALSALLY